MGQQFSVGLPQTGLIWMNNVASEKGEDIPVWLTETSTSNVNPLEDASRKPDGVAPHWLNEFHGYRHKCLIVDVAGKTTIDGAGETFNITAKCFPSSVFITEQQNCTTNVLDANTVEVIVENNPGDARVVSFKVNSNDFNEVVSFTQETGHSHYLDPSEIDIALLGNAQIKEVYISSCTPWSIVSSPSWITATQTGSLFMNIQKNQSGVRRMGYVTLINLHDSEAIIRVSQDPI